MKATEVTEVDNRPALPASPAVGSMFSVDSASSELEVRWRRVLELTRRNPLSAMRQIEMLIVLDGIPPQYRGEVWLLISGAKEKYFLNQTEYQNLLKLPIEKTAFDDQIEADTARMNNTREVKDLDPEKIVQMQRMLKAYARYDPQIGYVQGMVYIAMLILQNVHDEEFSFWLLVCLMNDYDLKNIHNSQSSALHDLLSRFDDLLNEYVPTLRKHFIAEHFTPELYMVECLSSFYVTVMPVEVTTRIWDLMLMRIPDTLLHVGLAVIYVNQEILIKMSLDDLVPRVKQMFSSAIGEKILPLIVTPPEPAPFLDRCILQ